MYVVPPVVWLDTPARQAVAEHVLQRSLYALWQLEKRGLKIHRFKGRSSPEGDRRFIVVAEYLKFLDVFSD
jgi:hypothetical protein